MASVNLSARLPERELAIAAWKAGMVDASRSEIAKYCILLLAGYDPVKAKEMALSLRNQVTISDDENVVSVRVPNEWLEAAKEKLPDASPSFLFRFSLARLTAPESEAMKLAHRNRGPVPGSRRIVTS